MKSVYQVFYWGGYAGIGAHGFWFLLNRLNLHALPSNGNYNSKRFTKTQIEIPAYIFQDSQDQPDQHLGKTDIQDVPCRYSQFDGSGEGLGDSRVG